MEKDLKGLCFRCEHRACFLETGARPRYECGDIKSSVYSCYMFKPVKPISIEPNKDDKRPLTLNMLSCRIHKIVDLPELQLKARRCGQGIFVYWQPKKRRK